MLYNYRGLEVMESECCGDDSVVELNYHSDLDLTTGICENCRDHCNFHKTGDEGDYYESSSV